MFVSLIFFPVVLRYDELCLFFFIFFNHFYHWVRVFIFTATKDLTLQMSVFILIFTCVKQKRFQQVFLETLSHFIVRITYLRLCLSDRHNTIPGRMTTPTFLSYVNKASAFNQSFRGRNEEIGLTEVHCTFSWWNDISFVPE